MDAKWVIPIFCKCLLTKLQKKVCLTLFIIQQIELNEFLPA